MEFKYFFITERIFLITKLYLIIAASYKDNCMQKAVDTVSVFDPLKVVFWKSCNIPFEIVSCTLSTRVLDSRKLVLSDRYVHTVNIVS